MVDTPAEKSILPSMWQVPQLFRNRLGSTVGRQRAMAADGHLLLVLHAPPKPDEQERVGRFHWRSPEGEWTSNELGKGVGALAKHLDEFEGRIAALDRKEEQAKTAEDYFAVLDQLAPLYRAARNLHAVLQEARTMFPEYLEIIELRNRAYAIERTAELLFEGTKNSLEFHLAQRAEVQAKSSQRMAAAAHRLNILAAFFFPIVTLMAILGVDFARAAENFGLAGDVFFVSVLLLGLVAGGFLTYFVVQAEDDSDRSGEEKTRR
ncbi:MAG: hypothetical protein DWQ42_09000 [Planctomycetota bacterium]|nr:MAG: hypothetical protein DWQ42_09000 [Planctomycetota bacterium]REK38710.1 MAG: hypothetical protein DWQ46_19975 [Planctomycetota bacterium]